MLAEVSHGHSLNADQAVAELEQLGLHTIVADVPPTDNAFHWHNFDSVFYILEGSLEVMTPSGETYTLVAGDRVTAPGGGAHREKHNGYRAAFGFSVPLAELKFPLELPLPAPA